jgi:putative membrane protein
MTLDVGPAPEVPWQRLSARMLLIHPVHELLRLLPLAILLLVFGRGDTSTIPFALVITGAAVLIGATRWLTTEYRVTPDQVQIRAGLLQRRVSAVARDRVRAVELTARVMHRLLGLAVVTVGTGRQQASGDDVLRLDGLAADEAGRLRSALLDRSAGGDTDPRAPGETIARWRAGWVRYGPLSFSGFLTLGVLAGGAAQALNEIGPIDTDDLGEVPAILQQLADLGTVALVAIVALVLVAVAILLSTAAYFVAHFRFTLTREPNGTLHVSRGLLTTRATTLEERRLRGLQLDEPLPLRLARGARVTAIATGGDTGASALLLPPAPRAEARAAAVRVLGDEAPIAGPLRRHGVAATRRRWIRALGPAAVLAAASGALVVADVIPALAGALLAAALLAGGAALAADRARRLGHALAGPWLVARSGTILGSRAVLERDGVISVNVRTSFFQRRAGLCTLTATTAGGREGYDVLDVDGATAIALAEDVAPGLLTPFLTA